MPDRFSARQRGTLPMPWKETCVLDEKMAFIGEWLRGELPIGAVRAVWHQSRHRVPAGRALSERRTRRADAALAGAAPAWSGDGRRDRRGDRGAWGPGALFGD